MFLLRCPDFLFRLSRLIWANQPLRGCSKNSYSQTLSNIFVKYLWKLHILVNFQSEDLMAVLKAKSFTDILQELFLDLKQRCIPFWNFQNTYFTENFSRTAYELVARVLCNSMCRLYMPVESAERSHLQIFCKNFQLILSNVAFLFEIFRAPTLQKTFQ